MGNIQIEYLFTPKDGSLEIRVHRRGHTGVYHSTRRRLNRLCRIPFNVKTEAMCVADAGEILRRDRPTLEKRHVLYFYV